MTGDRTSSKTDITRPAVPHFFLDEKSAQGRADMAMRQALYGGAVGAQAMHTLAINHILYYDNPSSKEWCLSRKYT